MKILNFFRSKAVQVDNDRWEMFHFLDENKNTNIVSFDTTYTDQRDREEMDDEYALIIHIPESRLNNGLPHPEENISLNKMENALIRSLEEAQVDCKVVGRTTFNGIKTFLFETRDGVDFQTVCKSWQQGMGSYVVELKHTTGWSEYQNMLPNKYDWQQINDRKDIESLIRKGYTLNDSYKIEHILTGSQQELEDFGKKIQKDGFKVLLESGKLLLYKSCKLVQGDISRDTKLLLHKIQSHKVEYKGWQLIN